MYYVYILQSQKDQYFYVGYTNDLKKRKTEHDKGFVPSTKNRRPLDLVYYEACMNQQDATHREKYLKSSWGKRYIKSRLKNYLTNKLAAQEGGNVAGKASLRPELRPRGKDLEKKSGKKVSTSRNYLQTPEHKKSLE